MDPAPNPAAHQALGKIVADLVEQHAAAAIDDLWRRRWEAAGQVDGALRLSKAADVLDVSEASVRRLVAAGELETIEVAGVAHVRTSEINRWLDEQTARARRRQIAAESRREHRRRSTRKVS